MFQFFICAEMEGRSLLSVDIDSKHRARLLGESPGTVETLITRTPKENWMIHPAWLQRYMFYLFLRRMYIGGDTVH